MLHAGESGRVQGCIEKMSHFIDEFMSAVEAEGIVTKTEIPADGRLHRFHVEGDRPGSKNGWAVLFGDENPVGLFGSWKHDSGKSYKWYSHQQSGCTSEQRAKQERRISLAGQLCEAEEKVVRFKCRQWCSDTWGKAKSAASDHPYLKVKGVPSYGLKQLGESLLVPVRDVDGKLQGMQFIFPDGSKKFKTGTAKKGNYFAIGKPEKKILLFCEGYATGASIHKCTGYAVAVCFDAGNLKNVAEVLKKKYSDHLFIVCGDNDCSGVGQMAAQEAALAVGGILAVAPTAGQDFNDMDQKDGAAAVRACINATKISGQQKESTAHVMDEWEPTISDWPTIGDKAYRGLAGEFAALASEKSEADPVAVLATFLVRFGVEVGSGPTLYVGETPCPACSCGCRGIIKGQKRHQRKTY